MRLIEAGNHRPFNNGEVSKLTKGANQSLAEFWQKGVDLIPLAPRKRGEGKGENSPKAFAH
jgi:hypothetical protein